jgi:hypothetical protein
VVMQALENQMVAMGGSGLRPRANHFRVSYNGGTGVGIHPPRHKKTQNLLF